MRGSRNDCIPIVLLSVLIFQSSWIFPALAGEIFVSFLCQASRCGLKLSVVHSGAPLDCAAAIAQGKQRKHSPRNMRRLISPKILSANHLPCQDVLVVLEEYCLGPSPRKNPGRPGKKSNDFFANTAIVNPIPQSLRPPPTKLQNSKPKCAGLGVYVIAAFGGNRRVPQVRPSVPGTKKMGEARRPLFLQSIRQALNGSAALPFVIPTEAKRSGGSAVQRTSRGSLFSINGQPAHT